MSRQASVRDYPSESWNRGSTAAWQPVVEALYRNETSENRADCRPSPLPAIIVGQPSSHRMDWRINQGRHRRDAHCGRRYCKHDRLARERRIPCQVLGRLWLSACYQGRGRKPHDQVRPMSDLEFSRWTPSDPDCAMGRAILWIPFSRFAFVVSGSRSRKIAMIATMPAFEGRLKLDGAATSQPRHSELSLKFIWADHRSRI